MPVRGAGGLARFSKDAFLIGLSRKGAGTGRR